MIILGIDPGLATMGYGVIEAEGQKRRVVQFGTINTRAGVPTPQRLRSIFQGINQLLDIYAPDDVAFEELFFSKTSPPASPWHRRAERRCGGGHTHGQYIRIYAHANQTGHHRLWRRRQGADAAHGQGAFEYERNRAPRRRGRRSGRGADARQFHKYEKTVQNTVGGGRYVRTF